MHRCIIDHDILERFTRIPERSPNDEEDVMKGKVSSALFKSLCESSGKEKKEDQESIRSYLLALGLAMEMTNGMMFIPSLASDKKVNLVISKYNQF